MYYLACKVLIWLSAFWWFNCIPMNNKSRNVTVFNHSLLKFFEHILGAILMSFSVNLLSDLLHKQFLLPAFVQWCSMFLCSFVILLLGSDISDATLWGVWVSAPCLWLPYGLWMCSFVSFLSVLMHSSQHIGWPVIVTESIPDHSTTSNHNLHQLFLYLLETGFCLLWRPAGLTLAILKPQLPECCDYRHVLVCLANLYQSPFYVKHVETGSYLFLSPRSEFCCSFWVMLRPARGPQISGRACKAEPPLHK